MGSTVSALAALGEDSTPSPSQPHHFLPRHRWKRADQLYLHLVWQPQGLRKKRVVRTAEKIIGTSLRSHNIIRLFPLLVLLPTVNTVCLLHFLHFFICVFFFIWKHLNKTDTTSEFWIFLSLLVKHCIRHLNMRGNWNLGILPEATACVNVIFA